MVPYNTEYLIRRVIVITNQEFLNQFSVRVCNLANEQYENDIPFRVCQLRRCSATVYFYNDGTILLESYSTIVAAILRTVREDGPFYICVDFLRYAYGYTPTSCQHIRKFFEDYASKRDLYALRKVTYYPVK